jgi:putative phage-type endonuclease
MRGDAAEILQLWKEMTGQAEPENLDHIWAVRLGEATEQLNLEWFESKNGQVTRRGEVVVHPDYNWAACTLDGWFADLKCVVEAKCVGGREPMEIIIERYQPQMQHQMWVTDSRLCALSVIVGGNEPVVDFIDRDDDYVAEIAKRGLQFMQHVWSKTPPVVLPPVPPPVDASKIIDMTGNNQWAENAFNWFATRKAAEQCKDAEKVLKSMVPADAKKAFGHDVRITRDRAGRLSLREDA